MTQEDVVTSDATDPDPPPVVLARRLAEALESERVRGDGDLVVACGVAWTLVDLHASQARR